MLQVHITLLCSHFSVLYPSFKTSSIIETEELQNPVTANMMEGSLQASDNYSI